MSTAKNSTRIVNLMMSSLASGMSVSKVATKYKKTASSVQAMVNGLTYASITGLSKDGNKGLAYIRENKDQYGKGVTDIMAKKETPKGSTSTPKATTTTPKSTPSIVAPKTSPTPRVDTVVGVVAIDLSENVNAIRAEATTAISKLDARKLELEAELGNIEKLRTHWTTMSTM